MTDSHDLRITAVMGVCKYYVITGNMTDFQSNQRNSGIDVLRGLAILTVILLHINIRIPFSDTYAGSTMPIWLYKIVFKSGYYGVCMFFVISGFLISTTSIRKWETLPKVNIRGFYVMRFARIMPSLIALLIVMSVLHCLHVQEFYISPQHTSLGRAIFAALTFQFNMLEIKTGYFQGSWGVLWSLSIEEMFYLFFPVVCKAIRKEWNWCFLVLIFLVMCPFARTVWFLGYGFPDSDHNHFAFLDSLALGCLAAIIAQRVKFNIKTLNGMAIVGWILIIVIFFFRWIVRELHLGQTGLNVTFFSIGTALVLIWMQQRLMQSQQRPMLITGVFRFLGRNSYEVYLTHMFVVCFLVFIYRLFHLSGEWTWLLYLSTIILSGILGALIARYFSNPLNYNIRQWVK
jgi:peptidoglycan/LPS O-acetylase OafA/YrhL